MPYSSRACPKTGAATFLPRAADCDVVLTGRDNGVARQIDA